MKKYSKKGIILLILSIILGFSMLNSISFHYYQDVKNGYIKNDNECSLRRAGFWEIGPIEIDDKDPSKNWSITAATYDWCKGSGTWNDPYIIENVTIDGQNTHNCLRIDNSDIPFTIRNCTLINGLGEYWRSGGIRLENVTNGKIFNNNCSFNQQGIFLIFSNNNTISGNTVNNNTINGITLREHCNDTKIIGNTANFNARNPTAGDGIYIKNCYRSLIIGNNVSYNAGRGMDLTYIYDTEIINNTANNNGHVFLGEGITVQASENITVSSNKVQGNDDGLNIYNDKNCKIFNNTAISNEDIGIKLVRCINLVVLNNSVSYSQTGINLRSETSLSYNNTVSENTVKDSYLGISLGDTDNNTILGNTVKDNHIGIFLGRSNYNNVSGNILIGNDECIVEEDCVDNILENNDCIVSDKKPRISGYNLFFLVGMLVGVLIIIDKKFQLHKN